MALDQCTDAIPNTYAATLLYSTPLATARPRLQHTRSMPPSYSTPLATASPPKKKNGEVTFTMPWAPERPRCLWHPWVVGMGY